MASSNKRPCQCENREHFDNIPGIHLYEEVPATKVVQTPFGKFDVCSKCTIYHLRSEVQEPIDNSFESEVPL